MTTRDPQPRCKVLIAVPDPVLRRRVTALFKNQPDLCICATAVNVVQALSAIDVHCPDLVVIDVESSDSMDSGTGLIGECRASHPSTRIIAIGRNGCYTQTVSVLQAGAACCVDRERLADELLHAIQRAINNESSISATPCAESHWFG